MAVSVMMFLGKRHGEGRRIQDNLLWARLHTAYGFWEHPGRAAHCATRGKSRKAGARALRYISPAVRGLPRRGTMVRIG